LILIEQIFLILKNNQLSLTISIKIGICKMKILYYFLPFFLFHSFIKAQVDYPKRELRGAWIATVANIDWPSRYATSGEQIKELVDMMDKLKAAGINAVYFQIRTECDALYESSIEPWSYWLTGEQGKGPDPFFDPLAFAVDEAHKRCMELHAWFNPYRSVKDSGDYRVNEKHVSVLHPDWILSFDKYKMLNPGMPEVKNYIAQVITDVIKRYDIDGIHFDDYFYPYSPKVSNEDSITFEKYRGSITDVDDWRRNNINSMIAQVYDSIKVFKPYIKFGVSPFGIVENKYANTNGFNSYSILYCDPLTWIKDKTVDYVVPQLYWEIEHKLADYAKLLPWWASVTDKVHLYIGQYSSKMMGPRYDGSLSQIGNQIRMNRETENVLGSVFFSAKSILNNSSGFADSLKNNFYKYPALVPVMVWKDLTKPLPPTNLKIEGDSVSRTIKWENPETEYDSNPVKYFLIYRFNSKEEVDINNPKNIIGIISTGRNFFKDTSPIEDGSEVTYVVTSLDRLSNESEAESLITFSKNGQ